MAKEFVETTIGKTRREVLQEALKLFDDKNKLAEVVGTNALLDCTLMLLAREDANLAGRLNKYLSAKQLEDDIKHTIKNAKLMESLRRKLEDTHARI